MPNFYEMRTKYKILSRLVTIVFIVLLATGVMWGQTTGDYRTRQAGTWSDRTDWQRWDGDSWEIPTAGQGYPGQNPGTNSVTILNNISLNATPANAIGSLNIQANLTPDNNNRTLNISGDFSISAGTLSLSANNWRVTTLNIGGNFTMSGGTITESSNASGSINFDGAGLQTFTKTGGTISNTINFTVNNGSILDMGTSVLNGSSGSFTLSPGAGIITKHAQGISTTAGMGCVQVTGTKDFDTDADYTYNSSTGNQVTGNGLPATVRNLTIDNTAANGVVSLTSDVTVTNTLTLNSGILSLGANDITLGNGSILAGNVPSATNMVAASGTGRFFKYFATGNPPAFSYPIGDVTGSAEYSPVTLDFSANTVAGMVGVNVSDAIHPDINTGGTAADYLSRYWTFSTTGLTNYTYNVSTYQYNASDINGVEGSMKLSFWNGTSWNAIANSNAGSNLLSISSSLTQATGTLNGNAFTGRFEPTYYSSGNTDPSNLNNWWSNTNGTGSHPIDFTSNNQRFVVQNGHNMITGAGWAISGSNTVLQIQNGGTLTETIAISISANTTLQIDNGGTLNHNVNSISIFDGAESIGNTSTINYGFAGAQSVIALNYGNLSISGNGTKTLQGNITPAGNLTISGSAFDLGTYTANRSAVGGTLNINATGSLLIGGTNTFPANYTTNTLAGGSTVIYDGTNQNISIKGYSNLILSNSGIKTLQGDITVGNGLTISGTANLTFGTTPAKTLTVNGDFSFTSGAINMTGNAGVNHSLVLNGNTSCAPIGSFTKGTGTVTYGGAAAQNIMALDYYNLIKSGAGNATLCGDINVEDNLTISAGALSAGGYSINLGGDFINNSSFNAGTGNVLLNGSLSQTLGGSSNTTFNNLTVNNTSGIDLGASITVSGLLTLTNGNLRLSNNNLTISNMLAGGPFSNAKMIVTNGTGSLIKQGTLNSDFQMVYPIGTGTSYTPVEISSLSSSSITGTGTFGVRTVAAAASGIPGNNPLTRHWITSSANINSPVANIRFTYVNGDIAAPATSSEYDIMYNPGSWTVPSGAGSTGSNPLLSSTAANLNATWSATVFDKYTIPPGITSIKVECWGAGGGGSSIINDAGRRGGGGGGGAYAKSILTVIPGNTYFFIQGVGGAANSPGGNSSFGNNLVVAAGGNGATFDSNAAGTGGAVASSTGTVRYAGGNGANGDVTANYSGGGGGGAGTTGPGGNASGSTPGVGAAQNGGNGGTGINGGSNGQAGVNYGGGGSGASSNSATDRIGGNGSNGYVRISLPSQITLSSSTQVNAANVYQGTVKVPLFSFETAVGTSEANLTGITFSTSGTYIATDITRFQLWYNTTNNLSTATQVGSDISTGLGAGSHSLSGFSRITPAGTTGYFWITADVLNTATPNATLSVDAIGVSNLTYELSIVTGSTTLGGIQTILPVPRVALSSASPSVSAANVNQGTKNHPVYSFNTAITWADATLNSVTFTTGGNYAATDVLNFKLWYNTSNDFATASQLGSPIIGTLGTGSHTFSGLNLVTTTGSTGYFWITTDIAPFPNNGRTINVSAITTADLNYASIVFKSGTASAGNDQTIVTQNGVFITSTYPAVSANSILQGSLKQNVYKFSTIVSGAAVTLNSVSFTTSGTYVASDILNFKLHYNTVNSMVGATELATLTTGLGAGNHTFTGLSQGTNASTTGYFWITADVASGAVPAHTLIVDPITTGSLVYSGTPNKFSTTYAGGIQTIQLKIDSDNDGVADLYDLDDDNDGIPDIDENQSCNMAVAELFPNSNFDAGNTGFSSGYGYVTIVNQTSLYPEGIYAITPNANSGHNSFANCTGHGNMMVVNGSPNPNLIVWSSGTIAVTPNTDYTLSINLTSVNPANPAQLIFNVNGENIGLQFNATTTNCQWVPGVAIWNSGSNTSATFDIMNLNLIAGGNDFAIDDVSCKYKINCDYDGDNVPDKLDLDSDNDGIYDVVEAGGTATATGTINGFTDTDQDGLSDNVDNKDAGTGGPINVFNGTPLANPDTDTDGIPNRADTDSDNDFCPDTKEAGLPDPDGDGRLGSLPLTYDARGIVTSAVGYTGTIDTNSDGIKDYVQRIPYITTQPTDKTLCLPTAGTTFSITATNTGGTYQWQVSTDNGVTWSNLTNGGVYSGTSGAGVGALTINNTVTTAYNNYKYKILLTNTAYNCSPLESDVVSLYIYSGAPAIPGIISGNTTVCSSVNQNYSIALVPSATSYTWTVPAGWSIVSGQTTNAITASTGAGGGNIQVTATNFCGTSAPRTLAVNISAPTPTLTTPAATVCQSADVVYTTETGKTNYVWTVGGDVGVDYVIKAGGTSTDNTLTLNWLKTGSKNVTVNYTSGGCPGLTPASVSVTVNPNAMVLTQPVTPAPVCAGAETVTLSITASGASGYQWQVSTDGGSNWNNLSNAGFYSNVTTATLTITNPPISYNNYQYRCVITGSCGNANSYSVTLTVNDIQPATANAGSAATCSQITANWTASSNATKYFLDVSTVNTFASFVAGYNNLDVGNVTTYNVTGLSAGTTYYYRVRAYNTCGSSSNSAIITYATSPATSISSQSTDTQTKCNGDAFAAMSVTAAGTGTLTYQWYSNTSSSNSGGTLITGATSASYTPLSTTNGTLYYYCIVTGGCGSVTSSISGAIIVTHRPNTGDLYRKPNN